MARAFVRTLHFDGIFHGTTSVHGALSPQDCKLIYACAFFLLLQAMNRSLANVILGGYSITRKEVEEEGEKLEHQETDINGAVDAITNARSIIIVPGYGLAVASAQYAIADLVKTLTSKDIKVRLAPCLCPASQPHQKS